MSRIVKEAVVSISAAVQDHFEHPRHVGRLDESDPRVGTGLVGSPARGVVIRVQIRCTVDDRIDSVRFKAYGCVSCIAAASFLSDMLPGRSMNDAGAIAPQAVMKALSLPGSKAHCATLATQALGLAIDDLRTRDASESTH